MNGEDVNLFHFYYGPLYSVAWIVSYPLIILGSQSLWHKVANRNNKETPRAMMEISTKTKASRSD
jgi:hypothetical protein